MTKSKPSFTPFGDRLLVKIEDEEKKVGNLWLADIAREKPNIGQVLAVGPGRLEKKERIPIDARVGDRIVFGKYAGTGIKIDGEELLILKEDEVFGTLK